MTYNVTVHIIEIHIHSRQGTSTTLLVPSSSIWLVSNLKYFSQTSAAALHFKGGI